MSEKLVLAYSGGLDTSASIKWLKEKYGYDVITFTADVGNNEKDLSTIKAKAEKTGAVKAIVRDIRAEFVRDYIFPALKAGAFYEGQYPMATSLARPLIAKHLVEVAREEGASAVAHGSTGKGNDQVRFDVSVNTLAPDLKIVAPAREWGMSREETIKYSEARGIPVPATVGSPYSVDVNLWGRSIECGCLEDPWVEPPEEVYAWTNPVEETPDKPTYITIGFEKGVPVSINNKIVEPVKLIETLSATGGKNGVGRIDMVENRLVGIKSREIYEAPAAVILLAAHQALEALTLSKPQVRFKEKVAQEYADLVYNGLWFSAFRLDLDAFIDSTQQVVIGEVRVKLFKGTCRVVGRKSPLSLYNYSLATYDKADAFNHSASIGFIHIFGLPVTLQAQAQSAEKRKAAGKGK
jgi:argininosuccinate synthase